MCLVIDECSGDKLSSLDSRFHNSFQTSSFLQKFSSGCRVGSDPCYSHECRPKKKKGEKGKTCTHTLLDLYIDDLIESIGHFEVDILVPMLEKEGEVNGLVCGGAAQLAQPSLEPSMA